MNIILFDDDQRFKFLPLAYTRPIAEFRIGISTITDKWKTTGNAVSWATEEYLQSKYPIQIENENLMVNSRLIPDQILLEKLESLSIGSGFSFEGNVIAFKSRETPVVYDFEGVSSICDLSEVDFDVHLMTQVSDVFSRNSYVLKMDFEEKTQNRKSQELDSSNILIGPHKNLFIEEGATVLASTLNVMDGPIYIGSNATVMEGCNIRGGLSLGDNSTLKMGAKIYGATTIGPHCKIGGEVNNSVVFGYSNKAHDGFLGNSVIGEWCNLGADTNNSNLKNNYAEVKLWDYKRNGFSKTGLTFCGLILGDHSKSAINTQFNTGTVVGVCSNVFGAGFPRNFIPSFTWGGAQKMVEYRLDKTFEVAEKVFARRNVKFDKNEQDILSEVYDLTSQYRN